MQGTRRLEPQRQSNFMCFGLLLVEVYFVALLQRFAAQYPQREHSQFIPEDFSEGILGLENTALRYNDHLVATINCILLRRHCMCFRAPLRIFTQTDINTLAYHQSWTEDFIETNLDRTSVFLLRCGFGASRPERGSLLLGIRLEELPECILLNSKLLDYFRLGHTVTMSDNKCRKFELVSLSNAIRHILSPTRLSSTIR